MLTLIISKTPLKAIVKKYTGNIIYSPVLIWFFMIDKLEVYNFVFNQFILSVIQSLSWSTSSW